MYFPDPHPDKYMSICVCVNIHTIEHADMPHVVHDIAKEKTFCVHLIILLQKTKKYKEEVQNHVCKPTTFNKSSQLPIKKLNKEVNS